jgi:hypothetical protein
MQHIRQVLCNHANQRSQIRRPQQRKGRFMNLLLAGEITA